MPAFWASSSSPLIAGLKELVDCVRTRFMAEESLVNPEIACVGVMALFRALEMARPFSLAMPRTRARSF